MKNLFLLHISIKDEIHFDVILKQFFCPICSKCSEWRCAANIFYAKRTQNHIGWFNGYTNNSPLYKCKIILYYASCWKPTECKLILFGNVPIVCFFIESKLLFFTIKINNLSCLFQMMVLDKCMY